MKNFKPQTAARVALILVVGALVVSLAWPLASTAQDKTADPAKHKHADKSADADKDLAAQVRDLQAKIAKLEAALKQGHKGTPSGTPDTGGMGGMPMGMMGGKKMGQGMMGMGGMEAMKPDEMMGQMMQKMGEMMQMMGQMKGNGMSSMGGMGDKQKMGMGMMGDKGMGMMDMDMQEMMGMMGMGGMGQKGTGMGKMQMATALPGFPGASHIYHIGATGFFLDHPEHITLTTDQQTKLNQAKQKALAAKASAQRKIDEAEQQLWELTAADEPDAKQIQAKIQEIEQFRGEQRLAFIRSVGEAAKVLTDEQRKVLLGQAKPDVHKAHPPSGK